MKKSLLFLSILFGVAMTMHAETGHENFMNSKIKTNTSGDFNTWVHGSNDFSTVNQNDWNNWHFTYLGLEGDLETQTSGDYTSWKLTGLDITLTNSNGNYNNWVLSGEDKTLVVESSNWDTWAISGSLVSGISTTDTGDFSEWVIQGGDWTSFSPQYRAAVVFISVFSSSVLKNLSE
jgi:hypothetical protein